MHHQIGQLSTHCLISESSSKARLVPASMRSGHLSASVTSWSMLLFKTLPSLSFHSTVTSGTSSKAKNLNNCNQTTVRNHVDLPYRTEQVASNIAVNVRHRHQSEHEHLNLHSHSDPQRPAQHSMYDTNACRHNPSHTASIDRA